ncbi:MAG: DUF192 domain-containing protein [Silicimonas sp.]|nr:DUF192 domain-containing protein [Silicimonas sp.]
MGSRAERSRLIAFVAALVAAFVVSAPLHASCQIDRVDIRGDWGTARFTVEVADDPSERSRGLMDRDAMPTSAGMLFVYEHPQRATFWMKNTLIPLDMIFMDQTGRVTRVHENAVPLDLTGIEGGEAVQFVLEINGGLAGRLGIDAGSELRHPAIGDDAAWTCD